MSASSDVLLLLLARLVSLLQLHDDLQKAKESANTQVWADLSDPIAANVLGRFVVCSWVCLKLFLIPVCAVQVTYVPICKCRMNY